MYSLLWDEHKKAWYVIRVLVACLTLATFKIAAHISYLVRYLACCRSFFDLKSINDEREHRPSCEHHSFYS